jgi:hypothetical protein
MGEQLRKKRHKTVMMPPGKFREGELRQTPLS